MKPKVLALIILTALILTTGCGEIPLFVQPESYILPQIMVETPTTGPDGYKWDINEQGELILEKEGESVTLEVGQTLLTEGTEWVFTGVEKNLIILKPFIEEVDPMDEMRRQLD